MLPKTKARNNAHVLASSYCPLVPDPYYALQDDLLDISRLSPPPSQSKSNPSSTSSSSYAQTTRKPPRTLSSTLLPIPYLNFFLINPFAAATIPSPPPFPTRKSASSPVLSAEADPPPYEYPVFAPLAPPSIPASPFPVPSSSLTPIPSSSSAYIPLPSPSIPHFQPPPPPPPPPLTSSVSSASDTEDEDDAIYTTSSARPSSSQIYPFSSSPPTSSSPRLRQSTSTSYLRASASLSTSPSTSTSRLRASTSSHHLRASTSSGSHHLRASTSSLRTRIFGLSPSSSVGPNPICTTPGSVCAGETETETDEPSKHLPTARLPPPSSPLIPLTPLESKLTPFLFEFSRLLSIFPAIVGTLWNLWFLFYPPIRIEGASGRRPPERIDYFVAVLWCLLTGYQCLALTTGLLTRWRLYYPPLSTLVRLLALQGICWPATQLGLTLFEHEKRPVVCWAVIGTTTCISRAVQIWVTSNLWWDRRERNESGAGEHTAPHDAVNLNNNAHTNAHQRRRKFYWKRWGGGGKWGGRRWDWREVSVKCVMPVAGVYFVMAWAEQVRRVLAEGC